MRDVRSITVHALLILLVGCQSSRSRPPSDVSAVRKPTFWDHLFSDKDDERDAIASRLSTRERSLLGTKTGLMRSLREHELEAQLSSNGNERSRSEGTIADLRRQVDTTEQELDWVASRQQQNHHDRAYWPDHDAYRKPVIPASMPIVEAPIRIDVPPFPQQVSR